MSRAYSKFVITVLILSFLTTTAGAAPWDIDKLIGSLAPEFTLRDTNGREVSLSDFKGKIIFLNFWATWCPACKEEIPTLNRLQQKYRSRGLVVIGISSDRSIKKVKEFIKRHRIDYLILLDSNIEITRKYRVFALPTSFLIDSQGRVIKKFIGAYQLDNREIEDILNSY